MFQKPYFATLTFVATACSLCGIPMDPQTTLSITPGIEIEHDTSVFANALEASDTVLKPSLSLGYRNASGLIASEVIAGVKMGFFDKYGDQDYTDFSIYGALSYPNGRLDAISWRIEADYTQNSQAIFEVGDRAEIDYGTIGGTVRMPWSEKFAGAMTASHQIRDAQTAGFVDQTISTISAELAYIYSSKLELFGSYRFRPSKVTTHYNLKSTDHAIQVGARGDFTDKLSGTVGAGYQMRDFTSGDYKDTDGLYVSSRVTWAASEKTQAGVFAVKDFDTTATGLSTDTLSIGADIKHQFTSQLAVTAGASLLDGSYTRGTDKRSDDMLLIHGQVDFMFNEHGTVYLMGSFADRSSNEDYFTYERARIAVGANYIF